ncbi:MAG: AAA family ATPase [Treponema sp.]|uniref:TraG/VirB4 family ATPase n=1 Tax=Treponema sp. TaxID=166 RepID=UPI0025DF7FEC|nr:AAA family ATPase [Treponema sp.]MBQ8678339.1 AAA family ATPase [Treponema sp.]
MKHMIPFLDLRKAAKEPQNQLKYITPYSFIISPSVCLLKNGAVMTSYQVEYPDLESSSASSIASMASLFNRSVMSLAQEEGWAVFFDVRRYKTKEYPSGEFSNLAGWLIDQRRAENYHKFGEHFTTDYYITFVYQLPSDMESRTTALFFKSKNARKQTKTKSMFASSENLPAFQKEVENFLDEVEKVMGTLATKIWCHRLDDSELFSYIKSNVSLNRQDLVYPEGTFFFLDNFICDMDVRTSMPLKIGEYYAPVIAVMDFPNKSYPGIFDRLNRTMTEFRWTTRFIPLSKELSAKEADKYQKRMYSARKSAATLFTEIAANVEIDRENQGAMEMESEASQIQADIAMGEYVLGYYTSNLMCWDRSLEKAKEKSRRLQQVVRSCGFATKEETFNNVEAWCGMMAGNVYSNIRRPLISTKNMSNIIPLSSAWQGMLYNDFTLETCGSAVPLLTCSTSYGTPFFLNLNVRDVGHTFVFGPTGAGKSTLLALLMAQATKYKDANIVCIDKQLSSRAFMVAAGGVYVEPGKDTVAFQPLSELLNPNECTDSEYRESLMWCQQFIEALIVQQNIEVTPQMSRAISEALRILSEKPSEMHDLTSFQGTVSYRNPENGDNTIRTALDPYCSGGAFGAIFDADKTTLSLSKLMTIEMGSLMRLSEKAVAPALMYIFRYLEKLWTVPTGARQPLTFLFLDEAWLYLQHPVFAGFIQEWLRTLRKKKVFCIFATQEVSAASKSSLRDTIVQQCLTKIYLADESAISLAESYRDFGLTESEIVALSEATMKRDYYFKNPNGSRMFTLDLDAFQLALISSDHEILDRLESEYGRNTAKELAFALLDAMKEKFRAMGKDTKSLDYEKYEKMLPGDK